MAKRRKLEAPSIADLEAIDVELSRTDPKTAKVAQPPIAQVAAETAALTQPATANERIEAEALRRAREEGRLMIEVPLEQISARAMVRDRSTVDDEEMQELCQSIAANGLRLPIELYDLSEAAENGERYGIVSGYRRYLAVETLKQQTGDKRYEAIKAVVTTPQTSSGAFVAMVEENEIRANLSPFERGRISVVAVGQGAFESVEQAVNVLFASVSKAKRSKVRSFAAIFEELGDLLRYPENLSERQGLRLAAAIRSGQGPKLRAALSKASSENAWDEWASVEPVLELSEAEPKSGRAGGRPRKATGITAQVVEVQHLATGHVVSREMDRRGTLFRIEGPELNDEQAANVMEAIRLSMGPEN